MARKTKQERRNSMKTNSLAKSINSLMGRIYQSTYFSSPDTNDNIENLKNNIDSTIEKITTNNMETSGEMSISRLYTRLYNSQKGIDAKSAKNLEDFLNDKSLVDGIMYSYAENQWIRDYDDEIDTTCRYMPKLIEALNVKKENVLSSDHFQKDFLNVKNETSVGDDTVFPRRIKELKSVYKLNEIIDRIYDETGKYGETFVYILPYKPGIEKLMKNRGFNSSFRTEGAKVICEGVEPIKLDESMVEDLKVNINLELVPNGILEEAVRAFGAAKRSKRLISENANEIFNEVKKDSKLIDDELSFDGINDTSADGFVNLKTVQDDADKIKELNGCILKILPRESIIPIEIEGIILGYYYMEFTLDEQEFTNKVQANGYAMATKSAKKLLSDSSIEQRDRLLGDISKNLSTLIDSKFVNANQDLKKEIYMLLKHNEVFNSTTKLRVTFIPPEYMEHVYFEKDPNTHRGVSDLKRALLPAKIYSSLYITNSIALMTRGQDKRVYYVKQHVDTNIGQQLMNVINQIKKGNFGARQLDNINNVLNITGRFNDYVIPIGPSGDAPITFEVMQGQSIDVKTDFMNMLEELAINNTDVPLEIIQARQSIEYASQLTMSNTKFLRMIYNRQAKFEPFLSRIVTKIYQYEYSSTDKLSVSLPPPMFLNITNTNSMLENTRQYCTTLAELELSDTEDANSDVIRNKLIKKLCYHYLSTYIDIDKISELREISEQETIKIEEDNPQQ